MKTVFIAYDQAHHDDVLDILNSLMCRGFTWIPQVGGRGTKTGEPHMGSHAWPAMNNAVLTIVDDEKVDSIFERLRKIDEENPMLGLRAFVWGVEKML